MDLASVVAALASVGVRVSGSTPNSSVQVDSSLACPTGLAGPEPSGTINDPGQHFHKGNGNDSGKGKSKGRGKGQDKNQGGRGGGANRQPDKDNKNPDKNGGNPNPNPGGNSEASGGQSGPTTRSQTQAQREQGAKREHEGGDDGNAKKRSRFMRMARKLRNKGFEVTCPAEF